jgi:hypothetical protein
VTSTVPPAAPPKAARPAKAEDRALCGAGLGSSARPPAVRSAPLTISRVLAVGVAVALAVDAYVHATSSGFYDPTHGGIITEGNLFRAEAAVSSALAVLLLLRPSGWTLTAALVVAASALAAVVLYRYVDVGAIGPIPNLYEPTWRVPGKLPSAYAEGVAAVLSAAGIALTRAGRHRA